MPLKPPIPEKPYFCSKGWNPDANGLSIQHEEASDVLNMRITRKEAFTRAGTRELARNRPGNDNILHYYDFKAIDGTEKLFGFSKDNVYEYHDGTGLWTYAHKFEALDTCEAVANWSSDNWTPTLTTAGSDRYEGSYAVYISPDADLTDTEVLLAKGGAGVMDWDTSGYTHITFQYMNGHTGDIDVKVKFYSDNNFTTLIESFDKTLSATTVFKECACEMTTPANFDSVKSWEIVADGAETVSTQFDLHVDYVCGITKLSSNVTFWHTCRFVDTTEGETIIAAGSSPPILDDAETDGGSRAFLFYDTSASYFDTLSSKKRVAVVNEDTGETGPNTESVVNTETDLAHDAGDSGFSQIVKGTFEIYTLELGTLATASSVLSAVDGHGSNNGYFLIPTDETKIEGGANSWVKQDGRGNSDTTDYTWSLEFKDDTYHGMKLYVRYTYEEDCAYKPRYVWSFHNRVLMGNVYENPTYHAWRVRWTAVEDMDLMTDTDYADLVDTDITSIVGGETLGFYLNIYKTHSIVKCSHVGGDSIFLFTTVWKEGTYAGRTIQAFRNRHYLLGKNDIYVWDGNSMRSITQSEQSDTYRTRDKVFTLLNQDELNNCFASIYPKFKEYWLWIVKTGETYPTSVFVYSILQDIWYYFEFDATVCTGEYHIQGAPTIDELIGTIDEQNWTFEASYTEGAVASMILSPDGENTRVLDDTIGSDGGYYDPDGTWNVGTAISTRLITRDFIFGDLPRQDRVERVDFEAYGTSVDVSYSSKYVTDPAAFLVTISTTLTPAFEERHYFPDAVGEHIRFLFESDKYWAIRWVQPYAVIKEIVNE